MRVELAGYARQVLPAVERLARDGTGSDKVLVVPDYLIRWAAEKMQEAGVTGLVRNYTMSRSVRV